MSLNFTMSDLQYFNPEEYFTYAKNINSYTDLGLVVGKMTKPIMPQVQPSTQDVPGMYGNIFMGNDYGELTFTIPVTLMAFDRTSYNMICDNLRAVFTKDAADPGVQFPIVFGDNPSVKYYGHWGQMSDPTFLSANDWQARATLTFVCSQPYGYLDQQSERLEYPNQPIYPQGNATTYPIYTMYLKQDVTGLGFADSNGGYVATGYNVDQFDTNDEGDQIDNKMPMMVHEEPARLSDWIYGKDNLKDTLHFTPDGDQAGVMGEREGGGICPALVTHIDRNTKDGNNIPVPQSKQVLNYGNPQPTKKSNGDSVPRTNFYGPLALHPYFDNPTDDWQIMVNLWNTKSNDDASSERAMGHNDIYLLDSDGQRRGRIWIHDWQKGAMPRVGFSLGTGRKQSDGSIDEFDIINSNDHPQDDNSANGSTGPSMIDGYYGMVNRPSHQVTIKSLYDYKETVKQAQKAKKQSNKRSLNQNRKSNARKSASRKRSSGKSRREHHHYRKGRKSSKGKIHRRRKK